MNEFRQNYPQLQEFVKNSVGVKGKIEIIWQPLFDWIIYPTAGIAQLLFFQNPQGAGNSSQPIAAAAAKTAGDTNMTQNGQLPAPQAFWIDGIEVAVDPGSSATANLFAIQVPTLFNATAAATVQAGENDVNAILSSGVLSLTVMQKEYYRESPLYRFPPRAGIRIDAAVAAAGTNAQPAGFGKAKLRAAGQGVRLDPGLGIPTSANFAVTCSWPALVTTPSGFNARVGCFLNGWLFRAAQ